VCPAIAWKKKAYRSKFDHEKNYVEFTQLTTRMLNAHTVPLASGLQEEILTWLKDVKEVRAHRWYEKYWMGPRGNYTNASAGYCGTNSAQGIESRWRYLKRDACGGSSGTKSLPLKVFVPALLTYLKAHSGRHCEKLLNVTRASPAGTNVAMAFPSAPTITSEMWKGAQNLDVRTLQLSHIECNSQLRRAFSTAADGCNTRCSPTRTWKIIFKRIQGQDRRTCWMSWKASTVSHQSHGAWAGFYSPAPAVMDFDALLVATRHCFQLSGIRSSRFQSTVLSLSCLSV